MRCGGVHHGLDRIAEIRPKLLSSTRDLGSQLLLSAADLGANRFGPPAISPSRRSMVLLIVPKPITQISIKHARRRHVQGRPPQPRETNEKAVEAHAGHRRPRKCGVMQDCITNERTDLLQSGPRVPTAAKNGAISRA
jgi:hypothetical protein